jgi:hypothetical protein
LRKPDFAHFAERRLIGFAEFLRHAQSRFAAVAQEVQKVGAADELGFVGSMTVTS